MKKGHSPRGRGIYQVMTEKEVITAGQTALEKVSPQDGENVLDGILDVQRGTGLGEISASQVIIKLANWFELKKQGLDR